MAYATVDELAAEVRVTVTAATTPRLQACLNAATVEIDHAIGLTPEAVSPAATWLYSTVITSGDPGPGRIRLNKATPGAATALYIDQLDADGTDHGAGLALLTTADVVQLGYAGAFARFQATGPVINRTGWYELPVDLAASSSVPLDLTDGVPLQALYLRPGTPAVQLVGLVNRVNVLRGAEWWKAVDAAGGALGSAETGVLPAPRSSFARHAATLTPLVQSFGVA